MIRLGGPKEPRELDIGAGVKVVAKPLTFALYRAAVHSAERISLQVAVEIGLIEQAGGSIRDIPDPHDRDGMRGLADQYLVQALARHAITAWSGVGDETGSPAVVTAEAIDAMIRDYPLQAERFERQYLAHIEKLVSEGNGSGAALNGISAAAPSTAEDAESKDCLVQPGFQVVPENVATIGNTSL